MLKRLRLTFVLLIIFCLTFILTGCEFWKNTHLDVSTYDDFTNELFYSLVGQDELTCNYFFNNREDYGFSNYEPKLPTPSLTSVLSTLVTNAYFGRIEGYDYNELNDDQKMIYNLITDLLTYVNSQRPEMGYLSNNYLGTYLGYQAQLPLLLVEYHFRNEQDINSYMLYLEQIPDTFKTYYDFEVEKADHGYGMPDFVIDNVVSQCNTFIMGIDDNTSFMYNVIEDKIDSCTFLDNNKKEEYKNQNEELVKTSMREGYSYIASNLDNLKGRATNNQGLAHYVTPDGYEIGKAYYEARFKYVVGYDDSCIDAVNYIDNNIVKYYNQVSSLLTSIKADNNLKEMLDGINNNEIMLMTSSPDEQINYYLDMLSNDFPALTYNPNIELKLIDPSMQNNFSPAAYMKSAIDEYENESIYLNPASIYLKDDDGNISTTLDGNYLFNTLAHEGLPGHLYQNCYFKNLDVHPIRKLLSNIGYTEGWATYAENYVYEYLRGSYPDIIIDYLIAAKRLEASIYSRLDLGIHYDGWSMEEAYNFMATYYKLSGIEKFEKAYNQLVEIPTNYQQYFYTYLKLVDLYDTVKTELGEDFDPVSYHKTILDCGSVPLKFVEQIVYEKYNINR